MAFLIRCRRVQQGQSNDHPLTEDGERQAELLGGLLRGRRWHRLYSSDLPRAVTTAHRALKASDHPVDDSTLNLTPHLREMCFGLREGHPRHVSATEARRLKAEELGISVDEVVDPAESVEELLDRQRAFLRLVVQDLLQEEKQRQLANHDEPLTPHHAPIFCMAHGGYISRFLKNICNVKGVDKIHNCAVSIVHLQFDSNGSFKCIPKEDAINLGLDVAHIP